MRPSRLECDASSWSAREDSERNMQIEQAATATLAASSSFRGKFSPKDGLRPTSVAEIVHNRVARSQFVLGQSVTNIRAVAVVGYRAGCKAGKLRRVAGGKGSRPEWGRE